MKKSKDRVYVLSTVKCRYSLKYLYLILSYYFKELGLLSHFCKKSYENAKGLNKLLKSCRISPSVVCWGILLNIYLDEVFFLYSLFHPQTSDPLIPSPLISWQIPGNRARDRHSTQKGVKRCGEGGRTEGLKGQEVDFQALLDPGAQVAS